MPDSSSRNARHSDEAIRAAVIRLSRPNRDGDAVIERAAIVAEGESAAAMEAWIFAHGGEPEAVITAATRTGGLHGQQTSARDVAARPPRRYVLPAGSMS